MISTQTHQYRRLLVSTGIIVPILLLLIKPDVPLVISEIILLFALIIFSSEYDVREEPVKKGDISPQSHYVHEPDYKEDEMKRWRR